MIGISLRPVLPALTALALAACASSGPGPGPEATAPLGAPEMPSTIRPEEIVGSWGFTSYQKPEDRQRTETAARNQCGHPYVISRGPNGGVVMHLADQKEPVELRLKGSPSGKNYIGPPGPAGGPEDREIVSFNGRVLVTRYMDPDAANRYGNMVYVRCGTRA